MVAFSMSIPTSMTTMQIAPNTILHCIVHAMRNGFNLFRTHRSRYLMQTVGLNVQKVETILNTIINIIKGTCIAT